MDEVLLMRQRFAGKTPAEIRDELALIRLNAADRRCKNGHEYRFEWDERGSPKPCPECGTLGGERLNPVTALFTLDELKAVAAGHKPFDVGILLASGWALSRKTIQWRKRSPRGAPADRVWFIKNHIDDTKQVLSDATLWTESNIGEALDKGALVLL